MGLRFIESMVMGLLLSTSVAARPAAARPKLAMQATAESDGPIANAAFAPGEGALPGPEFTGTLVIRASPMRTLPAVEHPMIDGRDMRVFPGIRLEFFTMGEVLVPVQRGQIVCETHPGSRASYWCVIAQYGKVWREAGDGDWSRAAFPLMLVNDTDNHAQLGLATFRYRTREVSALTIQFVQQTGAYLIAQHFVAWGGAPMRLTGAGSGKLSARRAQAAAELDDRLPAKRWRELVESVPAGTLDGFGGPVYPKWQVAVAWVREGTLYYQDSLTPYGPYPYPLEMRFGVRSLTKSIIAPLALLRLAQVYGPWVLALKVGDYVPGLDPKWRRVSLLDAANMATGWGGMGSLKTQPNDMLDGYLSGHNSPWYTARSRAGKLRRIALDGHPYPWEPGAVMRYREQDYTLLGAAIDALLKSLRGPRAELGRFVQAEVLTPIGIHHMPTIRTHEAGGRLGLVMCDAGYYPTLDELAKIAALYASGGSHDGVQILNHDLVSDLMVGHNAIVKDADASLGSVAPSGMPSQARELYELGFHLRPYVTQGGAARYLPYMHSSGDNDVILFPNGAVSVVMTSASAARALASEPLESDDSLATIRAAERLAPF